MRVVLLGTYDLGKPRTRLLRRAMHEIDDDLTEIHQDVWAGVEDKASMNGAAARITIGLKLLLAYPVLAIRYLLAGRHDVVVIGYMGLFDVLLLAPLAKLRGKPVIWDAFLSIYDTYARDRRLGREDGWKARMLEWMEQKACRMADAVVLDTQAHAALMGALHGVPEGKLGAVLVGAEEGVFTFDKAQTSPDDGPLDVLFYGQFIPLHGIDTIIEAALSERGRAHRWTIIGQGQEAARIDALLAKADTPHLNRTAWVNYEDLGKRVADADICLGIFGSSDKASRVIPNKVYQAILADKPLVTRDSPAMRELSPDDHAGLYLVPHSDPDALLDALDMFAQQRSDLPAILHQPLRTAFAFPALVQQWRDVLERTHTS